MSPRRRRSLLEDDDLVEIDERAAPSGGDVCERCLCTRSKHDEDGCACGKCDGFDDGSGDDE
jgi:hypothetical protein